MCMIAAVKATSRLRHEGNIQLASRVPVGEDIAWDLAPCAALVVMSGKKWIKEEFATMSAPFGAKGNMLRRPWVRKMYGDGKVEFDDGSCVHDIDTVMFCTGAPPLKVP